MALAPSTSPSPVRDAAPAPAPARTRRPALALLALAIGGFAIGTAEFASMGLLPQIADGVGVSIPTAGHLISSYALGVVVGAPVIAAVAARVPRRRLLLVLMTVFLLGNLGSALARSFDLLLVARFVAGLPHGAYFGVASVVAASLVAPERRASAVAQVMIGLTVANIAGVPGATWAGQHLGWPALYVAVSVVAVVCLVAMTAWVPTVRPGGPAGTAEPSVRAELSALARPQVWFALATGTIGFGGLFATYSFIAPTLTQLAGMSERGVVAALATYGVGMTVGVMIGGPLADRALKVTLIAGMAGMVGVLATFGLLASTTVGAFVAVFLLGSVGSVVMPALQTRLMDVAANGQSLAAALNHATLNIGNALGAALGGAVLAAGLSYAWPSRVSAVLPLLGLTVFVVGLGFERRSAARRG